MGALAACGDQCVGWHLLTPVTPSEVFHPFYLVDGSRWYAAVFFEGRVGIPH